MLVVYLLAEYFGQLRELPHAHTHDQVRPLRVARADMLRIGLARDRLLARPDSF